MRFTVLAQWPTRRKHKNYFIVTKEWRDHSPNQIHLSKHTTFPSTFTGGRWCHERSRHPGFGFHYCLRSPLLKHTHVSYWLLVRGASSAPSLHFLAVILLNSPPSWQPKNATDLTERTDTYFLLFLEVRSLRSRCQKDCCSWGLSLQLVDGHLLPVSTCGPSSEYVSVSQLLFL